MFRHRGRKEDVVRGVLAKSRLVTQKQMCSDSEILLNYSNEKITISGFGRKFILKLHLLFFSPRIQTKMAAAQFLPKPFIISSTVYCTVVYRYCFIIKNTHLHVSHTNEAGLCYFWLPGYYRSILQRTNIFHSLKICFEIHFKQR